ncbi:MAG TPA: nitrilase-related carbon-nitrogen hydrolase [Planctomycetota bacterium]|nr:nitrilase-related carbon-nitrogen hydrolase [Planctomycetota bacterium]
MLSTPATDDPNGQPSSPPAEPSDRARQPIVFLGGLFSAFFVGLALPPFEERVVAWFALVPLLFSLDRHRTGARYAVVHGLWFAIPLAAWHLVPFVAFLRSEPPPALAESMLRPGLGAIALEATVMVLSWIGSCVIASALFRRRAAIAILGVPTVWVGLEVLRSEWLPRSVPFLEAGTLIKPSLPEARIATLAGVSGLGWLILLSNTLFTFVLRAGSWRRQAAFAAAAISAPLVALAGGIVLGVATPGEGSTSIGLVQTGSRKDPAAALGIAHALRQARPTLIVFSGGLFAPDASSDDRIPAELRALATEEHLVVIGGWSTDEKESESANESENETDGDGARAGPTAEATDSAEGVASPSDASVSTETPPRAELFLVDARGKLLGVSWRQTRLAHEPPRDVAGAPHPIPTTSVGAIGLVTASDTLVPGPLRRLSNEGAEILVACGDRSVAFSGFLVAIEARMAGYRALENGRWLVRVLPAGVSSVIAPSGKSVLDSPPRAEWASIETISSTDAWRTPYLRGGWVFGPACLALTLLIAIVELADRLRRVASGGRGGRRDSGDR